LRESTDRGTTDAELGVDAPRLVKLGRDEAVAEHGPVQPGGRRDAEGEDLAPCARRHVLDDEDVAAVEDLAEQGPADRRRDLVVVRRRLGLARYLPDQACAERVPERNPRTVPGRPG
jgi:hypothetical protein